MSIKDYIDVLNGLKANLICHDYNTGMYSYTKRWRQDGIDYATRINLTKEAVRVIQAKYEEDPYIQFHVDNNLSKWYSPTTIDIYRKTKPFHSDLSIEEILDVCEVSINTL